jgi:hypothetical protein
MGLCDSWTVTTGGDLHPVLKICRQRYGFFLGKRVGVGDFLGGAAYRKRYYDARHVCIVKALQAQIVSQLPDNTCRLALRIRQRDAARLRGQLGAIETVTLIDE